MKLLPGEEFILVAESFSGGIAAIISQHVIPHLKGIIFVASFLSAPQKVIAQCSSYLPLRFLAHLPLSSVVYRLFFLGKSAGSEEIKLFKSAIDTVSAKVLKLRLKVIAQAKYDEFKSSTPIVYIGGTQDKLVSLGKRVEFFQAYSEVTVFEVDGPHFILQAKPKAGAVAILEAVSLLTSKGTAMRAKRMI